ncbi:MAG: hypothetical protein HQ518_13320 [Rhodopirellula sp.]|nr:hypothetical protein [Rhodopirellula sp.]
MSSRLQKELPKPNSKKRVNTMKHRMAVVILAVLGIAAAWIVDSGVVVRSSSQSARAEEGTVPDPKQRDDQSQSVTEARGRARLLHETIHGVLQVMHRDFFREDEGLKIPSQSLDVGQVRKNARLESSSPCHSRRNRNVCHAVRQSACRQ